MIKIHLDYEPNIRGLRCYIVDQKDDGSMDAYEADCLTVHHYNSSVEEIKPCFTFDTFKAHNFLQELSNALVRAGFKPDEIKASDKQVEAMKYHLEDMRKLVFRDTGGA